MGRNGILRVEDAGDYELVWIDFGTFSNGWAQGLFEGIIMVETSNRIVLSALLQILVAVMPCRHCRRDVVIHPWMLGERQQEIGRCSCLLYAVGTRRAHPGDIIG